MELLLLKEDNFIKVYQGCVLIQNTKYYVLCTVQGTKIVDCIPSRIYPDGSIVVLNEELVESIKNKIVDYLISIEELPMSV